MLYHLWCMDELDIEILAPTFIHSSEYIEDVSETINMAYETKAVVTSQQ